MEENGEDEAFRREFLGKMSNLLGLPSLPVSLPAPGPLSHGLVSNITHLEEVYLMQSEIDHLRTLVEQYRTFALEISGPQKTADKAS